MYVSDSRIGSGARRNIAVLTRLANGFTVRDEVPRGGRFSCFESRLGMGTPAGQWNWRPVSQDGRNKSFLMGSGYDG